MLSIELNNCAPTTLGTPLWIPQSAMPIGFGVLFLQIIRSILEDIVKISRGDFTMDFEKEVNK